MSTSDFSPGHRALPRIFANPKESQLAEITQLLFQSGSEAISFHDLDAMMKSLGAKVETRHITIMGHPWMLQKATVN
jgi:Ca2+-binding EF-hand superfamily protein